MEDQKIKGLRTINGAEEVVGMVQTRILRDMQLATEISTKANTSVRCSKATMKREGEHMDRRWRGKPRTGDLVSVGRSNEAETWRRASEIRRVFYEQIIAQIFHPPAVVSGASHLRQCPAIRLRKATVDGLSSFEYLMEHLEDNLDAKRAFVGRIAEIVYSAVDEQTRVPEGPGCAERRVIGAVLSFGQFSEGQNARDACRERQTKVELEEKLG
ncbi:hypothetical protein B0H19DRAFT_1077778 [Mycena capillaripes]|nr:hypothetical protein B0H19DRAFT_1077778 [Mycena capillaripes]